MITAAHHHRPMRLLAVLSGGLTLVLALVAAASPSSSRGAIAAMHAAAGAGAAASSGTWGTAMEVPGLAALNKGGFAEVLSVSCGRAGNCSAGGFYEDAFHHHSQAFVAGLVKGIWGPAQQVPGTAALNKGGAAVITSVSCARAGNCSAGGGYTDASGHRQAFVAMEVNGIWGPAQQVPGTAALNKGGAAAITSVSCPRAGNCSAGGFYETAASGQQLFVAGEANGIWRAAEELPGIAALNKGGGADISSVSCARAGNCSAGGFYTNALDTSEAFVAGEANGIWGAAQQVSGTAGLFAEVTSVSCARAGTCSAGGDYTDASSNLQAFVAAEVNGTWGTAMEVPGTAALNKGGVARTLSVSCARAGTCSAGGHYLGASGGFQAFVAGEMKGVWGPAQQVPGTAALNKGGFAEITSMSCARAGTCSAGGDYTDASGHRQVFVAGEAKGIWGPAQQVPGTAALNKSGGAQITSVSCARAGHCSAGGFYTDASGHRQAFVVNEA